jgi:hypothetical protein
MKKKLLSMLLVCLLVLSLVPTVAFAAEYSDTTGHWGEAAIDRWSEYDVVNGKGNGIFDPDGNMKRGEAAQVFANLLKLDGKADLSAFSDVGLGQWYDEAIAKCVKAGIMNGVGDGKMDPNGTITREMFFVMFARALGIQPVAKAEVAISDGAKASDWAAGYITALVNKGYVKGTSSANGSVTVEPKLDINRASVMSLLNQTIATYVNTTEEVIAGDGLVLVVVDNAKVSLKDSTGKAEVYAFGQNAVISNAPAGTTVVTSDDANNVKVNGKALSKDTTTVVEEAKPAAGGGGGGNVTPPAPTAVDLITKALAYAYDPAYTYTTVTTEGAVVTFTAETNAKLTTAMNDFARFLGGLYRGAQANKIVYNSKEYTWNNAGALTGSNWVDSESKTLVSQIVADFQTNGGESTILTVDGQEITVKIVAPTAVDLITKALAYAYDPAYTYTTVTTEGAVVTFTAETNAKLTTAMNDFARFLGGLYRGAQANKIVYNSKEYTWNNAGALTGSNWVDSESKTLVSQIVADFQTNGGESTILTVDGQEITVKIVAPTAVDLITKALAYAYDPAYTYTTVTTEGAVVTFTAETNAKLTTAMNDFARFLGGLYRGAQANKIVYNSKEYTWNNAGALTGSNWVDSESKTLVSQIVADFQTNGGESTILTVDGQEITVKIVAPTAVDLITKALAYAYDPAYTYTTVTTEGAVVTFTAETNAKLTTAMNDFARFLGGLYRGAQANKIVYNSKEYTWNNAGALTGSNWVDSESKTLVSQIVADFQTNGGESTILTVDGQEITVKIVAPTAVDLITKALAYAYDPAYTYTTVTTEGAVVTFTAETNAKLTTAMNDFARFLGGLYRGAQANKIVYNSKEYTWNNAGALTGSNWVDSESKTLVSQIVADFQTNGGESTILTVDGQEITVKIVAPTAVDLITKALAYAYDPAYTYTTVTTEGAVVTFTAETNAKLTTAMNDFARFLGGLYRGAQANKIVYNSKEYTWNNAGALTGSNWVDSESKTLVSQIVADFQTNGGESTILTVDGQEITVKIVAPTAVDLITKALAYAYDPAYTYTTVTTEGAVVTFTAETNAKLTTAMNDFARFLGGLYRGAQANKIVYNSKEYTWNNAGALTGSNWVDSESKTLVSQIVADFQTNGGESTILTVDGQEITVKIVAPTAEDLITAALAYEYNPAYTYTTVTTAGCSGYIYCRH